MNLTPEQYESFVNAGFSRKNIISLLHQSGKNSEAKTNAMTAFVTPSDEGAGPSPLKMLIEARLEPQHIAAILHNSGSNLPNNLNTLTVFATPGVGPDGQPGPSPLKMLIEATLEPQHIAFILHKSGPSLPNNINALTALVTPSVGPDGQPSPTPLKMVMEAGLSSKDIASILYQSGPSLPNNINALTAFTTPSVGPDGQPGPTPLNMVMEAGLSPQDIASVLRGSPNSLKKKIEVLDAFATPSVGPDRQPEPSLLQKVIEDGLSMKDLTDTLNELVAPLPDRKETSASDILLNTGYIAYNITDRDKSRTSKQCFRRTSTFTARLRHTTDDKDDLDISSAFVMGLADPDAWINNAAIPNIEEEALNPEAPSMDAVFPPITSQTHIEALPYVIAPAEVEEQPTPQPLQDADAIDANIGGMNNPGALLHGSFFEALEELALNPETPNIDVQLMPENIPHTVSKAISGFNEIGQILTDFLEPSPDRERQVACNILAEGDNPITSVSYNYFWEAAQPEVHTHVLLPSVIPPQTQAEPSHIRQQTVGGTDTKRARVEDYHDSFVGRLRRESLADIYSDPSTNNIPRRQNNACGF